MIHDLKPYAAYKDSGVPWLGQVPEHWEFERARWLFQKMNRPTREDDDVVTCFRDGIVTLRKNRRVRGFTESLKEIGYQGVRRGDLVIHAMDAFAGAIGVSDSDGKCTPVYSVCQPCGDANSYYYSYIVREMARSQWIMALAKGIRERSTDFRYDGFASQRVPLPPLSEQSSIVRYLDYMDRRIRRYIHAKQKLIKLLEEQKQAIIHRAVTRGLDPNVKLKPSGVEWLGDVPEGWEVKRLKYLVTKLEVGIQMGPFGSSLTQLEDSDTGFKLYGQENTISGDFSKGRRWLTPQQFNSLKRYELLPGDLVLTRKGSIGKCRIVPPNASKGVADSDTIRVRLDSQQVLSLFIEMLLHDAPYVKRQIEAVRRGAILGGLNTSTIANLCLVVPPLIVQKQIFEYIVEHITKITTTRLEIERDIALLREYRTRLIADVVTGKLDMREAAASLPDEVEEPEVLEDELDEGEEGTITEDTSEGEL
ncbi:restriction endonuclease S subunit [Methanomethylovorans hollandica DSM 15978]|uniref:Restriction endonuclease S subunit n=1 Tax=Methanomethylovorans hollandica (strain DSM 15978 / NBRC 107637 / DMS1) TaxID=867904 RepID=L0KU03_METHD|nr:restriction endonuclease subunit S [Methanomethylovorans hollandica]AGB48892.1 restriction endonuclease S subunit [Methanomethylovorans hollandica DSM 15978]